MTELVDPSDNLMLCDAVAMRQFLFVLVTFLPVEQIDAIFCPSGDKKKSSRNVSALNGRRVSKFNNLATIDSRIEAFLLSALCKVIYYSWRTALMFLVETVTLFLHLYFRALGADFIFTQRVESLLVLRCRDKSWHPLALCVNIYRYVYASDYLLMPFALM